MSERGSALVPVLLLLVVLIAGGGYNYWRNLQAEESVPRPYRGYSDADLATLKDAHRQEGESLANARARQYAPREIRGGGFIDEQIRQFDATHAAGRASRRLAEEIADHGAMIAAIEREEALRLRDANPAAVHWRRLTSF